MVSFLITSFTTEQSLMDELSEEINGVLKSVVDVYEKENISIETIEKLYSSDFIAVRFYDQIDQLVVDYGVSEEDISSVVQSQPLGLKGKKVGKFHIRLPVSIVKLGEVYITAAPQTNNTSFNFHDIIIRANILSILFGSVVMLITAGFIVKPVKKLRIATARIAKGDFQVYIENNRNDEIGQLIDDFNTMTGELAGMEMLRNNFISDISHEFKTPLTSIAGYAKLLRKSKEDEKQKEYIDIIMEETRHLSDLAGNILLLNRIENNNILLEKEFFRLDEQVRRAILLYENKWNSKEIEFRIELAEISYEGNEQLLYQVWLNLMDNAIKFSKQRGIIEICLKKNEEKIIFSIKDYGKGMSDEEKKRMFEKFYTGDQSRNKEGNGLGLSIVKRIVDMHNGKIKVTSDPNEFTEIRVELLM